MQNGSGCIDGKQCEGDPLAGHERITAHNNIARRIQRHRRRHIVISIPVHAEHSTAAETAIHAPIAQQAHHLPI